MEIIFAKLTLFASSDIIDENKICRGRNMKIEIQPDGIWYHGSNMIFSELKENSTITQWKELAEAFSPKPSELE